MLLSFKVKNFRSINEEIILDLQATSDKTMAQEATFECGKTSLLKTVSIYGPNASGKSNTIKAFIVFRSMILESMLRGNTTKDLPSEYFKLSSSTEKKPSFFEMRCLIDEVVYIYGFEIDKKRVCSEWLEQEKGKIMLFERNKQEIVSNKNYFKEASAVLKEQTLERVLFLSVLASNGKEVSRKLVEFIQKTNYISGAERGDTLNYSFGQFLNNPKMASMMKDFIVEADFGVIDIQASEKMVSAKDVQHIPDKFKELLFKEDSKIAERNIKFLHKKFDGNKNDGVALDFFAEESEGTQQMFALSAPWIDTLAKGKILFVDEMDASLHPTLCQYLITIFNSKKKNPKNAQLIFTTHDISLLNDQIFRRDQVYFTNKNKKGSTELFSLADISERKGVDFAKRYMEGRYSALPYISSYEDLKFSK